jgi:hypothetical protein
MNAAEDDASTTSLTNAVSNFGAAYTATHESLRNNNAIINAMQGQSRCSATSSATTPPPE